MNYYLGIDIGTSGCKAVIFDENGRQKALAYREYDIISKKPGWAELDTDEVIKKCFEVIRETASSINAGSVKGLGISSQGDAFTLIDKDGKALCNALVSSDIRANELINPWTDRFGEEKLYSITGHTPHPMFSIFKLLWIRDNNPGIWEKTQQDLSVLRICFSTGWELWNHPWDGHWRVEQCCLTWSGMPGIRRS